MYQRRRQTIERFEKPTIGFGNNPKKFVIQRAYVLSTKHEARHATVPTQVCVVAVSLFAQCCDKRWGFRPHIPRVCLPSCFVDEHDDPAFCAFSSAALRRLPWQLRAALVEHDLDDAGEADWDPGFTEREDGADVLEATGSDIGASIGYGLALLIIPFVFLSFLLSSASALSFSLFSFLCCRPCV